MSLQQFLKEQAVQLRSPEARERRDEWLRSVDALDQQLRRWLHEADPERILSLEYQGHQIREEGLFPYTAGGLDIILGGRLVQVVPIALHVVGPMPDSGPFAGLKAQGRVDLVGDSGKYHLYRYVTDEGERWAIVDEDRYRVMPLDRDTFEEAIQRLLA